jgi:gluconokinase
MQIFADVLGEPVFALREREATSRGLALLGLEHLGVIDRPSTLLPETGSTYDPNPERHEVYEEAVRRQAELYERLLD